MKNTIEAIKFIFSNEDGDFEPIAVVWFNCSYTIHHVLWTFYIRIGMQVGR